MFVCMYSVHLEYRQYLLGGLNEKLIYENIPVQ